MSLSTLEIKIDYTKFRERMKLYKHDGTSPANLIGSSASIFYESMRIGSSLSAKYINKTARALRMNQNEIC